MFRRSREGNFAGTFFFFDYELPRIKTSYFCGRAGTREIFSRRSRRLRKFYGRGGILPLHFYFSPTDLTDFTDFLLVGAGTRGFFSRRSRRLRKFYGRGGILPLHFFIFSRKLKAPTARQN